jgi:hypothetical protein
MGMGIRMRAGIHGAVPMAGLFLASFSLTWLLQPMPDAAAIPTRYHPGEVRVAPWTQEPVLAVTVMPGYPDDALPPAYQREPTLLELTVDSDPGTSSEAQVLLGLLNEEQGID